MPQRIRPDPWDCAQVNRVQELLTAFVSDKPTVAAVMGCKVGDLDWLCRQAFGKTFARTVEHYALIGEAELKMATFKLAIEGNQKMLDSLNREHGLLLGPVERRRKIERQSRAEEESTDF